MYVSCQADLKSLVEMFTGAPVLAIDTEFHREKTYHAKLCLLQMATDTESAIVDPLAVEDLSPLRPIMQDPSTMKVFHAGSQDIEILIDKIGLAPDPVFDTQIAAGFLGYQQQIGYGALVKEYRDISLPKADSFTDWTRRPLSQTQLEYAISDVLYLPGIYRDMQDQLEREGRSKWLEHDIRHLKDPKTYVIDPQTAWRKVKRVSSLSHRQLAVAQAVAAWREKTAMRRDVPRRWILTDEIIVEISKRVPRTKKELLEVRGLAERLTERSVQEILDAIADTLSRDPETWPQIIRHRNESGRDVEASVDLMTAVLHLRARENNVAMQLLASHDDLVALAKGEGENLPIMKGWRRELVGDDLVSLLNGNTTLSLVQGKLDVAKKEEETLALDR